MAVPSYTPKFRHDPWLDGVSRVKAAGDDGFNARLGAIEAEFHAIAQVVQDLTANLEVSSLLLKGGGRPGPGRLVVEDAAVPLALRETDHPVTDGGLWRMPLDAGILRFDVNTAASGDFTSIATPLAMRTTGPTGSTVTVGWGANGSLKVRHIDGKHHVNNDDDALYLNYDSGKPVVLGHDPKPSGLTVHGDIDVRRFPTDDTTPSLTRISLRNRSGGAAETTWSLYTAAVGGGFGVQPNGFEIWQYPATQPRLRIGADGGTVLVPGGGNVGVGRTPDPQAKLAVQGSLKVEEDIWFPHGRTISASGRLHIFGDELLYILNKNGAIVSKSWGGNGNLTVEGTLNQACDVRLKTSIEPLGDVLDKVDRIRGVSFVQRGPAEAGGESTGEPGIGVIAQEVEAAFPQLVSVYGEEGHKAVSYAGLTGVLLQAVKELRAENQVLLDRVRTMEERNA